MPMAVIPLIAAVASTVIGATKLGQSSGDDSKKMAQQAQEAQQKQAQADADAKRKAILASLPNAQEQGGGSLDAPQLTNLASVIAGLPGEGSNTAAGRGALNQFLGTNQPTSDTMMSATYGLSGSQGS